MCNKGVRVGIKCDICGLWYHRACLNLTIEELNILGPIDNDSKKLYITWNIAVHRLYDLPKTAHTRFLTDIAGIPQLNLNLKCRFAKFLYKGNQFSE